MTEITRRTALGLIGAVAVPSAATVAVAANAEPERPIDRVNRLAHELADALNDYADGSFKAVISPSGQSEWPVSFRRQKSDLRQAVADAKNAMLRDYPGKQVRADILNHDGRDCTVVILTHDGDQP